MTSSFYFKGVIMKSKKEKKYLTTNFKYSEEYKNNKENITEEELKTIFNKKYFKYIKRIENREE